MADVKAFLRERNEKRAKAEELKRVAKLKMQKEQGKPLLIGNFNLGNLFYEF